jgi:hypothetical protein
MLSSAHVRFAFASAAWNHRPAPFAAYRLPFCVSGTWFTSTSLSGSSLSR